MYLCHEFFASFCALRCAEFVSAWATVGDGKRQTEKDKQDGSGSFLHNGHFGRAWLLPMGCDHNDQEHDSNGHQNDTNHHKDPVLVLRRWHEYVDSSGLLSFGPFNFGLLYFEFLYDGLLYYRRPLYYL